MITAELAKKIDLLPLESYSKVEDFVEQLIALNMQEDKETAFRIFTDKMKRSSVSERMGIIQRRRLKQSWQKYDAKKNYLFRDCADKKESN